MYYGIYKDEIKYYVDTFRDTEFSEVDLSKYLYVIKRIRYDTGNRNYGFTYEVCNNNLESVCLEINGWKVNSKFHSVSDWSNEKKITIDVMDINNVIQQEDNVYSIVDIVKLLTNYSQYYTWTNYNLYKETVELKKEVTQLKSQINKLELSQKDNTELKVENLRLKEEFATMQFIENENKLLKKKLSEISSIIFSDVKEDNNDIIANS
jgi:hydroxylamine reductase (hybrid-cluster protein)